MRQTSLKAYKELREADLGQRQFRVLQAFRKFGDHTDLEMVKLMNLMDANMLRPRRNELVSEGFIEEKGKRKCRISDRTAIIWGVRNGK